MGRVFKGTGLPLLGEGLAYVPGGLGTFGESSETPLPVGFLHPSRVERATPILRSTSSKRQSPAFAG